MKSPILFLVFNRPDTTSKVFEVIKKARPPKLYIAADGPRKNRAGEEEKCRQVRDIVSQVDWDCEVKTLFQNTNLGCGKGPCTGISWFFEQEEEGIVLEDDILPDIDFFEYCDELLEKYRNTEEVGLITGRNYLYGDRVSEDSYFFSTSYHIWGWASWKRVWENYQFDINKVDKKALLRSLKSFIGDKSQNYWKWQYFKTKAQKPLSYTWWDYQLFFSLIINRMLCIVPNINLIKNIGFGEDATHTTSGAQKDIEYDSGKILPLVHPDKITRNFKGDQIAIEKTNRYFPDSRLFIMRIKLRIKKILNRR